LGTFTNITHRRQLTGQQLSGASQQQQHWCKQTGGKMTIGGNRQGER
jgi:hypothetical protein